MRDRLINLIISMPRINFCVGRQQGKTINTVGDIADHLVANGVIAPPCNGGDTVYMPWEYKGVSGVAILTVTHIIIDAIHSYIRTDFDSDCAEYQQKYNYGRFDFRQFGKDIFASNKEAEKALLEEIEKLKEEIKDIEIAITHADIVDDWFTNWKE